MLYKILETRLTSVDKDKSTIEFIFSTADVDRHGSVIEQDWDLKKFKTNPVFINSHQYHDAAEVIGKINKIGVKDGMLQGRVQFAVEENPKAKVIFELYAGEYLNAASVGFIPKEFAQVGKSGEEERITKSELLEISAVSVPSNSMALAKQRGIDVDKLRTEIEDGSDKNKEENKNEIKEEENKENEEEKQKKEESFEMTKRPYPNEHSCRLKSPSGYDKFNRKNCAVKSDGKCIDFIFGIKENKSDLQAMRYNKDVWTEAEDKSHCKKHDGMFEPAKKQKEWSDINKELNKKQETLKKLARALKNVCEEVEVDTRSKNVRARNRRVINRVIRKLIKIKNYHD